MLPSLTSGVSGLDSFQEQMDVIGNNIANLNTTGYKASVVNFADTFSNTLQSPSAGSSTSSGTNPIQVGTGVEVSSVTNNWSQGAIAGNNGIASNLAINGNGFFIVKDPATGDTYATRDGSFTLDGNGYLVTASGDRLQGTMGSGTGSVDVQVNLSASTSAAPMASYSVNSAGQIQVVQTDGTTSTCGTVQMENFSDPQKLINEGNDLYSNLSEAGGSGAVNPGLNGTGSIQDDALELSNVDLSGEMANLISAQRAFEANSKIITTSNEVLQTVVNLKQS